MSSRDQPIVPVDTRGGPPGPVSDAEVVCHCRQVSYRTVEVAIEGGHATSLGDLQRQTTACTRCFGCRLELERMLEASLGPDYERTEILTLPAQEPQGAEAYSWKELRRPRLQQQLSGDPLPRRMYMPVLEGFEGHDVHSRFILFNSFDEIDEQARRAPGVSARADLMAVDGTRLAARQIDIDRGRSALVSVGDMLPPGASLPQGVGVIKLVIDAAQLGSFRPYFHLVSPGGITSTHEKAAPRPSYAPPGPRPYFWVLPVGYTRRPERAYMFLTATQPQPLDRHTLVWRPVSGPEVRAPLPRLELDQSACVPLHEHFPALERGDEAGTVRIEPNEGVPAGFMIRHDPEADLWRIQHL